MGACADTTLLQGHAVCWFGVLSWQTASLPDGYRVKKAICTDFEGLLVSRQPSSGPLADDLREVPGFESRRERRCGSFPDGPVYSTERIASVIAKTQLSFLLPVALCIEERNLRSAYELQNKVSDKI